MFCCFGIWARAFWFVIMCKARRAWSLKWPQDYRAESTYTYASVDKTALKNSSKIPWEMHHPHISLPSPFNYSDRQETANCYLYNCPILRIWSELWFTGEPMFFSAVFLELKILGLSVSLYSRWIVDFLIVFFLSFNLSPIVDLPLNKNHSFEIPLRGRERVSLSSCL